MMLGWHSLLANMHLIDISDQHITRFLHFCVATPHSTVAQVHEVWRKTQHTQETSKLYCIYHARACQLWAGCTVTTR